MEGEKKDGEGFVFRRFLILSEELSFCLRYIVFWGKDDFRVIRVIKKLSEKISDLS